MPGVVVMNMGGDKQGHQDVHVQKADHPLLLVPIQQSVDILDRERRCARWHAKDRQAVLDVDVAVHKTAKETVHELVDALASFACERRHADGQRFVQSDRCRRCHRFHPTPSMVAHFRRRALSGLRGLLTTVASPVRTGSAARRTGAVLV
jgi:hypothetical protein